MKEIIESDHKYLFVFFLLKGKGKLSWAMKVLNLKKGYSKNSQEGGSTDEEANFSEKNQ